MVLKADFFHDTHALSKAPTQRTRRIQVRRSKVHGKGVFALVLINQGTLIQEYTGERIDWNEALNRHPQNPLEPNHTFYFHLNESCVIDANVGGNSSRWINHACEPNCEAQQIKDRIFIRALRDLLPGEELFFDYRLVIDERYTPSLKKQFACACGSKQCRKTMLASKR